MKKIKFNIIVLSIFLGLIFSSQSLSQNEDVLTITTWYPSPYGVYTQADVSRSTIHTPVERDDITQEAGKLIYDDDEKKFYYSDGVNWIPLG